MTKNLGRFISDTDFARLKALFRAARQLRDAADGEDGHGRVQEFLLKHTRDEWQELRAAILDIEIAAERSGR